MALVVLGGIELLLFLAIGLSLYRQLSAWPQAVAPLVFPTLGREGASTSPGPGAFVSSSNQASLPTPSLSPLTPSSSPPTATPLPSTPTPAQPTLRPAPALSSESVQGFQAFLTALNQGDAQTLTNLLPATLELVSPSRRKVMELWLMTGSITEIPSATADEVARALVRTTSSGEAQCLGFRQGAFLIHLSQDLTFPQSEDIFGQTLEIGWSYQDGTSHVDFIYPYRQLPPTPYWPCSLLAIHPTAELPPDAPLAVVPRETWQKAAKAFLQGIATQDPELLRQRVFPRVGYIRCCSDGGSVPQVGRRSDFVPLSLFF